MVDSYPPAVRELNQNWLDNLKTSPGYLLDGRPPAFYPLNRPDHLPFYPLDGSGT